MKRTNAHSASKALVALDVYNGDMRSLKSTLQTDISNLMVDLVHLYRLNKFDPEILFQEVKRQAARESIVFEDITEDDSMSFVVPIC